MSKKLLFYIHRYILLYITIFEIGFSQISQAQEAG